MNINDLHQTSSTVVRVPQPYIPKEIADAIKFSKLDEQRLIRKMIEDLLDNIAGSINSSNNLFQKEVKTCLGVIVASLRS